MRHQIQIWLDDKKPLERDLVDFIAGLKQQRGFVQTIRDSLRLIRDLRQGKVEVLEQLFPFIKEYYSRATPPAPTTPDPDTAGQLEQIKTLLLQNAAPNGFLMAARQTAQLPAPAAPLELELKSAAADTNGGKNLLSQLLEATQTDYTAKPSKHAKSSPSKPSKASGNAPKQLAEFKPIAAPNFENLELTL